MGHYKLSLERENVELHTIVIHYDLPPASRTNVMFVKSVTMENDGHEECGLDLETGLQPGQAT